MIDQEAQWLDVTTIQDQADGYAVELNSITGEKRKTLLDTARLDIWVESQ